MSKHTPGPWTAHHGWEIGGPTEEHPDWCEITGGTHIDNTHISIHGHIGMANAKLIAAAPDMLEALKQIEPSLGRGYAPDGSPTLGDIARAAIAKAEGQR